MASDLRVGPEALTEQDPEALVWRVIEPAYDAVSIYDGPEVLATGMAALTAGQRALLALHWTVPEVCNGGFDQYFVNPTGILAREAEAGFHRIGAVRAAALMGEVAAAFPGVGGRPGPPHRERPTPPPPLTVDVGQWGVTCGRISVRSRNGVSRSSPQMATKRHRPPSMPRGRRGSRPTPAH